MEALTVRTPWCCGGPRGRRKPALQAPAGDGGSLTAVNAAAGVSTPESSIRLAETGGTGVVVSEPRVRRGEGPGLATACNPVRGLEQSAAARRFLARPLRSRSAACGELTLIAVPSFPHPGTSEAPELGRTRVDQGEWENALRRRAHRLR
jgi:hypothetical protein